jgi:hypothetical protein
MSWMNKRQGFRVVVHTTDDHTFEGTLTKVARDGLVLRAAVFVSSEGNEEMPGETFVPRDRVSFVQVPTGAVL